MTSANYSTALAIAELPEQIRGYGHVKEQAVKRVREQEEQLRKRMSAAEIAVVRMYEPAA